MKVILRDDVRGLGHKNDIVDVADGYLRNYLEPQGLARAATQGAVKELDHIKKVDQRKEGRLVEQAKEIAAKLSQLTLLMGARTGSGGRLYGSITAQDVAEQLEALHGIKVDKRRIHLQEPLKSLGVHTVPVSLFKGIEVNVSVEVTSETEDEAHGE